MGETESDAVFHLAETFRGIRPPVSGGFQRQTARDPPHGVHAVNAEIHQRSASCSFSAQLPFFAFCPVHNFRIARVHVAKAPQLPASDEFLEG